LKGQFENQTHLNLPYPKGVEYSLKKSPRKPFESYDVVVVGAGPAGSSAAQAAARKGAKVLLIDRKQCIGVPMQCAEFVSQWISHHALFSSRCILQSIETMAIHLSDEISYEIRGPGYVLDRTFLRNYRLSYLSGAQISIKQERSVFTRKGIG
jgi:hypothetical protein